MRNNRYNYNFSITLQKNAKKNNDVTESKMSFIASKIKVVIAASSGETLMNPAIRSDRLSQPADMPETSSRR